MGITLIINTLQVMGEGGWIWVLPIFLLVGIFSKIFGTIRERNG